MRALIGGLAVAALACSGSSLAQRGHGGRDARQSYYRCVDASGGVTSNMLDCIGTEYDYQDGLLNAAYRATMARLTPGQRIVLRNSQRKWLHDREPQCMKDAEEMDGGTLETVMRNNCMLFSVIARTDWVRAYRP